MKRLHASAGGNRTMCGKTALLGVRVAADLVAFRADLAGCINCWRALGEAPLMVTSATLRVDGPAQGCLVLESSSDGCGHVCEIQRPRKARSRHPVLGTVVRCLWGHLHRKGESVPCEMTFYSASDPDVIFAQLAEAGWSSRRVRVPKIHVAEVGRARATQPLCPQHTQLLAKWRR